MHNAFVGKLAARVAALKVASASDREAQVGPLINKRAVEKVELPVRDALAKGAGS